MENKKHSIVQVSEIIDNLKYYLELDSSIFEEEIRKRAGQVLDKRYGKGIFVSGLIAVSNRCRRSCAYCGLRAPNLKVPRFRLNVDEIKKTVDGIRNHGVNRIFFISGEDPGFRIEDILAIISHASGMDMHVTLGLGIYPDNILKEMKSAGADCYTMKFETSNRDIFKKVKPDISFDKRMTAINSVKKMGMKLGSGNIIGLEGETLLDTIADIKLMYDLNIDWAPIVPYVPSPGTPMAKTTAMGKVDLVLKEISILRILLPNLLITAAQPVQGSKLGFADPEGNRSAIIAGANLLFVDLTPMAVRKDFDITPARILPKLSSVDDFLSGIGRYRITG